MSTASPSVPATTASQYNGSSGQHAQPGGGQSGGTPLHGHAGAASLAGGSDAHVGHPSGGALYPENVGPSPHHLAGAFPGAQLSPMASPYGAYGATQHPMYGSTYSGHAYPPYPNYVGHMSHYAHAPHYPGTSNPAYHNPVMNSMVQHGGYTPHGGHMPSHHAQSAMALSMGQSGAGSPTAHGGAMSANGMMPPTYNSAAPQYGAQLPLAGRHRVTTTLWEDEGTLCFQVDAKGVCVARRHDNNMVNGTKLLNVCGMSRGKRDGILKNEKERIVVKVGAMHLKGVWISFQRGKQLAEQHGIADALYPLFEPNIQSFLYHPENYPRTAAVMAAAQERHAQRHYAAPGPGNAGMKELGGGSEVAAPSMPQYAGMGASGHWNAAPQAHESQAGTQAEQVLPYHYQYHPHYQHHPSAVPQAAAPGHGTAGMVPGPYGAQTQGVAQPVRTASATAGTPLERRMDVGDGGAGVPQQGGAPATPGSMGAQAPRRVSGLKRSVDDYEHSENVSGESTGEHVSNSAGSNAGVPTNAGAPPQATPESLQSAGFAAQGFLEDSVKMSKRPKAEPAQPGASATAATHPNAEPEPRPDAGEQDSQG